MGLKNRGRISFLISTIFLLFLSSNSLAQSWDQIDINTSQALREVHFVDSNNGWVVGDNGQIFYSANKGASWITQDSNTSNTLWSVHFADSNIGWAAGNAGTILSTTDGGENWTAQNSNTTERLTSIYFVDSSTGWAVGANGIILHTTDGGSTWNTQENFGDGSYFFQSVHAVSSNEAWAVANNNRVFYTSDGGSTWTEQRYTSGGTGWKSVYFIDNNTGIVVGEEGAISRTTDGGTSWSSISSGVTDELESVQFSDDSNGIIVGRNGVILTTTDAGSTWNQQTSPTTESLYQAVAIHPDTAWSSGANGTMLANFTLPDTQPPAAPSGIIAEGFDNEVAVRWDSNEEEDVEGYNIYKSPSSGITTSDSKINSTVVTDTTVSDYTVANGDTYYYAITAVDTMGNESDLSAEVSATPEEPSSLFTSQSTGITSVQGGDIAFADYDNDGDLDVAVSGINDGQRYTKIYRNDDQTFVDIVAGITPVDKSSIAWGDYDQDGDLDLAIMGDNGSTSITKIYQNTDSGFTELGTSFTGMNSGDMTWVDVDNDGDLDLAMTGLYQGTPTTLIYENNDGSFSELDTNLKGVYNSSFAWDDYDDDGDMDVAISGNDGSERITRIYENREGGFSDIEESLTGLDSGDITWMDIDNDGDLDLIISGTDGTSAITEIYENTEESFLDYDENIANLQNSAHTFGDLNNNGQYDLIITGTNNAGDPQTTVYFNDNGALTDSTVSVTPVSSGAIALADFDGDSMLDLMSIGEDESGNGFTSLYTNNNNDQNSVPSQLSGLNASVLKESVTLSWDQGTDSETSGQALKYNLRIGSSSGAQDIVSPQADLSNGYLRSNGMINGSQNRKWKVNELQPGTYYWSVQAVDAAKQGGSFASEQTFTITEPFTNIDANIDSLTQGDGAWGDYDSDGDMDLVISGVNDSGVSVTKIYQNNSGTLSAIGAGLEGVQNSSVAWGDYDNDGDLDLVVSGVNDSGTRIAKIYENEGGTFADISAGITGVSNGNADWGDYDNDGDLDLLISGQTGSSNGVTHLYENRSGTFNRIDWAITNYYGVAKWGDYDNDGDLDIAFSGTDNTGSRRSEIFENTENEFNAINANLVGVNNSSLDWGDYDNDGDLDLVLTGLNDSGDTESYIYENTASGFTQSEHSIISIYNGTVGWGDYDNDGDLDLVIYGDDGNYLRHWLYENTGDDFEQFTVGLNGLDNSTAIWGDYDNDGDLDLAVLGETSNGVRTSAIFRNNISKSNTLPSAVTNTRSEVVKENVTLQWDQATDAETASEGLTYNIRVGTTPGGNQIASAQADSSNGYLRLPEMGNVQSNTSWSIDSLSKGKYYWSVQAVDGTYEGGDFAVEDSFSVEDRFVDTESIFTALEHSNIAWGDYDNDGDLDFFITGQDDSGNPQSILYQNNGDGFSSISTSVTDLQNGSVHWKDIDGDGNLDLFITGQNASGAALSKLYENTGSGFSEIYAGVFTGVYNSDVAWGDYDNDGRNDLVIIGNNGTEPVIELYKNTVNGFERDTNQTLDPAENGEVTWVDIDQDGDLDLSIVGSGAGAIIYENVDGSLNEWTSLPAVSEASMAWGDLGNDGDLDLVYSGRNSAGNARTYIYNYDEGSFNQITSAAIQNLRDGSLDWADYDNDGDDDLLITGTDGTNNHTLVYDQHGGELVESPATLEGLASSTAVWGDYNGDQRLDILASGATSSGQTTKLYQNNMSLKNIQPASPQNLVSSVNNSDVSLQWSSGNGAYPDSAVSYNVRVGTSPGKDDIMSVDASLSDGMLKTASMGNVGVNEKWMLKNLSDGTYYWSVQAIDGGYSSSEFAEEQSFTVDVNFEEHLALQGVNNSDVAWADYDNDGDLEVAVMGYTGSSYITTLYDNDSGTFQAIDAGLQGLYRGDLAWVDYDNDDDLDLSITGQNADGNPVTAIYQNNDGNFTRIESNIVDVQTSSLVWGDYDNDGRIDLLITGWTGSERISKIYDNTREGFIDVNAELEGLDGSAAWGDYDNDGDLDLVITGVDNNNSYQSLLYENKDGEFVETESELVGIQNSSVSWGDYNNDGYLDLVIAGRDNNEENRTIIYQNDGGNLTAVNANLGAVQNGSVTWTDYDNDGDLDLAIMGSMDDGNITKIYENDDGEFFDIEANIEGLLNGSMAWADYDNDGDSDLVITGNYSTKIYNNRRITKQPYTSNSAPGTPQNIATNISEGDVTLNWDDASDSETPQPSLTHNVQIGTSADNGDIASPDANSSNGFSKKVQRGNAQLNSSYDINGLPTGTYFWRVQAIDGGHAAGNFTAVDSFRVATLAPPEQLMASPTQEAIELTWEPLEGDELASYYLYRSTSPIDSLENYNSSIPIDTLEATASTFEDESLEVGTRYYYRLTAVDNNEVESSFSGHATAVAGAPVYPQNIMATPGDSTVTVRWDPNTEADLQEYHIYRNTESIPITALNSATHVDTVAQPDTSLQDGELSNGQTYFYRITAVDESNIESEFSDQVTSTPRELSPPAPPQQLITTEGDGTISLEWLKNNEEDIDRYQVYGDTVAIDSVNTPDPEKRIGTVPHPDTTLLHKALQGDKEYFYRVTAVDTTEKVSGFSAQATATPQMKQPLPPDSVVAKEGDKQLKITWKQNSELDIKNYRIYRSQVQLDSSLTVDTLATVQYPDTAYIDRDVETNNRYYYRVTAYDNSDLESGASAQVNGVPRLLPPDPPMVKEAEAGETQIELSWAPNTESDLDHYEIYRSTTNIDSSASLDNLTLLDPVASSRDSTYIDTSVVVEQDYYYRLLAVDTDELRSGFSNQLTATTVNLPPDPPANLVAEAGDVNINLEWDENTEQDLEYYKIYRNTAPIDSLSEIENLTPVDSVESSSTQFTDRSVVSGNTYYYRITARDEAFLESGFSKQVQVISQEIFVSANHNLPNVESSDMAWGDYDNDGDLDLAIMGMTQSGRTTKIYDNTATGFVDSQISLTGMSNGALAWADYDNDGDLDLLTTGDDGTGSVTQLYENTGSGFSSVDVDLVNVDNGSVDWGDYDNDGDLDLVISGWSSTGTVTHIYENEAGEFTNIEADVADLDHSSVAWGDYDNDGDLDLALSGNNNNGARITTIYEYSQGNFSEIEADLYGVNRSSLAWIDYDNDNDLDLLVTGFDGSQPSTRLYENDQGNFVETETEITNVSHGSVRIGDYNNDGQSDLFLIGRNDANEPVAKIYRNDDGHFSDIGTSFEGFQDGVVSAGFYNDDTTIDFIFSGTNQNESAQTVLYQNQIPAVAKSTNHQLQSIAPQPNGDLLSGADQNEFTVTFEQPVDPRSIHSQSVQFEGTATQGHIPFGYAFEDSNRVLTISVDQRFYANEDISVRFNAGFDGLRSVSGQYLDGNNDGIFERSANENLEYSYSVAALADYNRDGEVNFDDLTELRSYWTSKDYEKELAPTIGEFPTLKVQPDSQFNINDLLTFIRYWNYNLSSQNKLSDSGSQKNVQKTQGTATGEGNIESPNGAGGNELTGLPNKSPLSLTDKLSDQVQKRETKNQSKSIVTELKSAASTDLDFIDFEVDKADDKYEEQQKSAQSSVTYSVNVNYDDSLSAMQLVVDYDPQKLRLDNIANEKMFNGLDSGRTVFISHIDSLAGVAIINAANFGDLGMVENNKLASLSFQKEDDDTGKLSVGYDIRNHSNKSEKALSEINIFEGGEIPDQFVLENNYPNPFNPATVIQYQIPEQSNVRLQIYDVLGRKVATLLDEQVDAGYYRVRWNAASQVASGVYFYVLDGESIEGNEFRKVKKMLLIK